MLNKYLQQVYRLCNDQSQTNYNVADLIAYVNEGRGQIASASQSIRYLAVYPMVIARESYPFSAIPTPSASGYGQIIAVRGISILFGDFRYSLQKVSFSKYQAQIRTYANSYEDVPKVSAQFGQGVSGSIYMYPVPSYAYVMEWDCLCLPQDLTTDADIELLPYPWTDSVQYYAAYKALEASGNFASADRFFGKFMSYMNKARTDSQPAATVNWYGRS